MLINQSATTKFLTILSLAFFIFLFACGSNNENNNLKANNLNKTVSPTATPLSEADIAAKTKIEEALKKAGFTDIQVDTTTAPFSIRGTVARDKMGEAIFVAQQAAGRDLKNEIIEKK